MFGFLVFFFRIFIKRNQTMFSVSEALILFALYQSYYFLFSSHQWPTGGNNSRKHKSVLCKNQFQVRPEAAAALNTIYNSHTSHKPVNLEAPLPLALCLLVQKTRCSWMFILNIILLLLSFQAGRHGRRTHSCVAGHTHKQNSSDQLCEEFPSLK